MERRLEEKGVELQAAEGQTAKAKDLLSRQEDTHGVEGAGVGCLQKTLVSQ